MVSLLMTFFFSIFPVIFLGAMARYGRQSETVREQLGSSVLLKPMKMGEFKLAFILASSTTGSKILINR